MLYYANVHWISSNMGKAKGSDNWRQIKMNSSYCFINKFSLISLKKLGDILCSVVPFATTTAILVNSMTLLGIALDRYLAIVKFIKGTWNPSALFCASWAVFVWGLAAGRWHLLLSKCISLLWQCANKLIFPHRNRQSNVDLVLYYRLLYHFNGSKRSIYWIGCTTGKYMHCRQSTSHVYF